MYLHAALTIHAANGKIDEETVKKVIRDAGGTPEDSKIKALVVALKDVNIEQVIKEATFMPAAPAQPQAVEAKKEEKKAEEDKKTEEQAAAGLSSLFG